MNLSKMDFPDNEILLDKEEKKVAKNDETIEEKVTDKIIKNLQAFKDAIATKIKDMRNKFIY